MRPSCAEMLTHIKQTDMYDQLTDKMSLQSVYVWVCGCGHGHLPPRLYGAGCAISFELGRIKNESAVMHY